LLAEARGAVAGGANARRCRYSYTSYVLITLCVWAFGQVMTSYITQSISRSVNVRTLGDKIRTLLRNELTIWRISGASPPGGEVRWGSADPPSGLTALRSASSAWPTTRT
jgi:hypothetical protein